MAQHPAGVAHEGGERTQLIEQRGGQLVRAQAEIAPAEAIAVGIARMGANAGAAGNSQRHGAGHHQWVTRVCAAGDVDRRDQRNQLVVAAHLPRSVALAHVGVEVDTHGPIVDSLYAIPDPR